MGSGAVTVGSPTAGSATADAADGACEVPGAGALAAEERVDPAVDVTGALLRVSATRTAVMARSPPTAMTATSARGAPGPASVVRVGCTVASTVPLGPGPLFGSRGSEIRG